MKLCHAAALTLMGWYLMMPPMPAGAPLTASSAFEQFTNAEKTMQLSQWNMFKSFDSAVACEKELQEQIEYF